MVRMPSGQITLPFELQRVERGLAVESVPAERAGMGSGANNTARYLGGAAGVALVVAIAAGRGSGAASGSALVSGWNTAALVSAGLCALGALIAAWCGTRQPSPVARRADALANRSGKQFRAQLVGGGEQRRG